jgi:hypothetical protein
VRCQQGPIAEMAPFRLTSSGFRKRQRADFGRVGSPASIGPRTRLPRPQQQGQHCYDDAGRHVQLENLCEMPAVVAPLRTRPAATPRPDTHSEYGVRGWASNPACTRTSSDVDHRAPPRRTRRRVTRNTRVAQPPRQFSPPYRRWSQPASPCHTVSPAVIARCEVVLVPFPAAPCRCSA